MNTEIVKKMMQVAHEENPNASVLIVVRAGETNIAASTVNTEAIARTLYAMTQKRNDPVGERIYEICKLVACNIAKDDNIRGLRMRTALNNAINNNYE